MTTRILALNGGSSSLKWALFAFDGGREELLASASIERVTDLAAAAHAAFDAMATAKLPTPDAVGHRLVHGGPDHSAPVRIDAAVRRSLDALVRFAPLHLPGELAIVDAAIARFPDAMQVACFDTAFHRTLPKVAERFALPRSLYDDGVRRYGFHGISYEYVVESIGADVHGRAVIAHLGNGASLAAVADGRSIDTTMGLTPAGGIVMGTRSGDLDPGVLVYAMQSLGLDAGGVERLVNRESGLLGVSEIASDMKTLLAREEADERARLAVDLFCYAATKAVGALAAVLGGVDTLVFTGGIGEHAAPVRERIAARLGHLGVRVDAARNAAHEAIVSDAGAACTVRVVKTDEERMIARHAERLRGASIA